MNTFEDYEEGLCSAEEYMREEYIERNANIRWKRSGEMTMVINKDGHLYFVFAVENNFIKKHIDGMDYTIRDMENGVLFQKEDVFYGLATFSVVTG